MPFLLTIDRRVRQASEVHLQPPADEMCWRHMLLCANAWIVQTAHHSYSYGNSIDGMHFEWYEQVCACMYSAGACRVVLHSVQIIK